MEETIRKVEVILQRSVTEEELRAIKLAYIIAYEEGMKTVWEKVEKGQFSFKR